MAKAHPALKSSADLAKEIAALEGRRDEISAQVAELQTALGNLQAALVDGGDATPSDIATAHNDLQAGRSTLEYVEGQIRQRNADRDAALQLEARSPHYQVLQAAAADIDDLRSEYNATVSRALESLADDLRVLTNIRTAWLAASADAGRAWNALGGLWEGTPLNMVVTRSSRERDRNLALISQLDAAGVPYGSALLAPPGGPVDGSSQTGPRQVSEFPFEYEPTFAPGLIATDGNNRFPDAEQISRRFWSSIAARPLPGVEAEVKEG